MVSSVEEARLDADCTQKQWCMAVAWNHEVGGTCRCVLLCLPARQTNHALACLLNTNWTDHVLFNCDEQGDAERQTKTYNNVYICCIYSSSGRKTSGFDGSPFSSLIHACS